MKKISVVTPIYNVEKYLRKCFDSLLDQSFEDFVIMAINDGSTDSSLEIIREYEDKYPEKIIGINKENGGYGSVLRYAIENMETPYFLVCDPDDYLDKDALKTLYELAVYGDSDITIGAKNFIYENSDDIDYDAAYNTAYTSLKTDYVYHKENPDFIDLLFIDPSPHAKLYKRSIVQDINFLNKVSYTDNILFYMSYLNSKKIIYTDKALAYYLVNRKGNTMTDVSIKAIYGHISVFIEILRQAKVKNPSGMFYYRMFESFKFILEQVKRSKGSLEEVSLAIDSIYPFIDELSGYEPLIKPYYKKYSKSRILERIKDRMLLNKKTSKKAFRQIKKRLLRKFDI